MAVQTQYLIGAIAGLAAVGIVVWLVVALRRKSGLERELAVSLSDHALCRQQSESLAIALTDHQKMVIHRDDQIKQLQNDVGALNVAKATLEARVAEKSGQLEKTDALNARQNEQLNELQTEASQLKARIAELQTLLDDERKQSAEKIALLNEAREQLKSEFQNLAQRIFDDKSQKFTEQNRLTIDHLISPLRDQIGDFKKRVDDVYDKESRDRASLQTEIHHLKELNQRISKEAMNLTRALKGDSKARGNWGEVVLERVLEASGLQKGREYETQVHLKDGKGKRYQPDVIVRLPQGKDVVVDAKVSLNDYEIYYSTEDPARKEIALKAHIESIRTHIRSLAVKSYENLEGVRSLDFVLMFIPIEAAFLAAVEQDRGLFGEAFDKNIMVVSPSTLLVTLRTIENIWRHEYQTRFAIEIAKKAGGLYNKFVGFVEALELVGQQLDRAKDAYQTASDRLVNGKGNLIRRSQELKALGVKAGKELPKHLLESVEEGEAGDDG
ncbi:MAG: DNA recombination protein RmuC [Desulfobacteraceae bacterium]